MKIDLLFIFILIIIFSLFICTKYNEENKELMNNIAATNIISIPGNITVSGNNKLDIESNIYMKKQFNLKENMADVSQINTITANNIIAEGIKSETIKQEAIKPTKYDLDEIDFIKTVKTYKDASGVIQEVKEEIPTDIQLKDIIKSVYYYVQDDNKINFRNIINVNVDTTTKDLDTFEKIVKSDYNSITKMNKDIYDAKMQIYKLDIDTLINKNDATMKPIIQEVRNTMDLFNISQKKKMANIEETKTDIYNQISDRKYPIDVEPVRNLANISEYLLKDSKLTVPSNLKVRGDVILNGQTVDAQINNISQTILSDFKNKKSTFDNKSNTLLASKFNDNITGNLTASNITVNNTNTNSIDINSLKTNNLFFNKDSWHRRCEWFKIKQINGDEFRNMTSDTAMVSNDPEPNLYSDNTNNIAMCPPQYLLNGLASYQTSYSTENFEAAYCCKLDENLPDYIDKQAGSSSLTKKQHLKTGINDDGGGNYIYLDRHTLQCPKNKALSAFHLRFPEKNQMQYDFSCTDFANTSSQSSFIAGIEIPSSIKTSNPVDFDTNSAHVIIDMDCNEYDSITNKMTTAKAITKIQPTNGVKTYEYGCAQISGNPVCTVRGNNIPIDLSSSKDLEKLPVKCNNKEVLTQMKLYKTSENKSYYGYTCCKVPHK